MLGQGTEVGEALGVHGEDAEPVHVVDVEVHHAHGHVHGGEPVDHLPDLGVVAIAPPALVVPQRPARRQRGPTGQGAVAVEQVRHVPARDIGPQGSSGEVDLRTFPGQPDGGAGRVLVEGQDIALRVAPDEDGDRHVKRVAPRAPRPARVTIPEAISPAAQVQGSRTHPEPVERLAVAHGEARRDAVPHPLRRGLAPQHGAIGAGRRDRAVVGHVDDEGSAGDPPSALADVVRRPLARGARGRRSAHRAAGPDPAATSSGRRRRPAGPLRARRGRSKSAPRCRTAPRPRAHPGRPPDRVRRRRRAGGAGRARRGPMRQSHARWSGGPTWRRPSPPCAPTPASWPSTASPAPWPEATRPVAAPSARSLD